MGGTSTDVSAWSGKYERSNDSSVAGVRLRAPMMKIHTIAAGGGSILEYKDDRYQVGPASAGANPGPASYRRGGPLTVTDANLLLGRIPIEHFPAVFGPQADQALDVTTVRDKFAALCSTLPDTTPEQMANGFLTVAIESMANAIRKITIERGEDVRDFVLCCFGGAGGQHACRVAEVLDIERIWLHPLAGVLSAYGMGLSDIRVERQCSVDVSLNADELRLLETTVTTLRTECDTALADQHVPIESRSFSVSYGLHIRGSETVIDVDANDLPTMVQSFAVQYRARFGAHAATDDLLIATISVEAVGAERAFPEPTIEPNGSPEAIGVSRMWVTDAWQEVSVFSRDALGSGAHIVGPAIVVEANGTTVVDIGWTATVNDFGHLLLERRPQVDAQIETQTVSEKPDPVRLRGF